MKMRNYGLAWGLVLSLMWSAMACTRTGPSSSGPPAQTAARPDATLAKALPAAVSHKAPHSLSQPESRPVSVAKVGPQPAQHKINDQGQLKIAVEDRCPVCAMQVSKHTKFAAGIQLDDGTTYHFCGTGCLIRSWLNSDKLLGVARERIKLLVVQDYFTGEHLDARKAVWIAGSDVVGPMGPALVPLRSDYDADAFVKRHGGAQRFRLDDVDAAMFAKLTGKGKAAR